MIFFNTSAKLSVHVFTNLYNQYLYSNLTGNVNSRIKMNVHPLPQTLNQETLRASLVALIIAIGFAFMPANFISFAVKEETDKVKHQQLISGVTAPAYWLANFAWDFLNYLIMAVLCLIVLAIWDVKPLIGSNSGATIVALILYGLSIIPFTYLTSFLFKSHTGAQNTMLLFFIITGAAFLVALIILRIISSTKRIAEILSWIVRLLPSYAFAESIAFIMIRSSPTAFGRPASLWDMEVCGWSFVYMTLETFVYFLMVLLVEKIRSTPQLSNRLFGNSDVRTAPEPDTDPDVIEERRRLQENPNPADSVVNILGLRKVYGGRLGLPPKIAVSDLWLSIPSETCLGLLGINGAGKTTTFKMLTGDIIPTSGTANLYGFDILTQQGDVRRHLGYCPQFDALPENLTGREILDLFARIKLVPADVIPDYIEYLIQKLGLQKGIADRPAKGYSGGNKRKLCVGMALIGNPPVVFLDEPSTGMFSLSYSQIQT
jgi:ABC-type Na+ transport system ATPase subunit NatA